MSHALHARTPMLGIVDSRGLPVRVLACHRLASSDPAELRVTRHSYDPAGRLIASRDPRLSMSNQRTVYSLSGQVLLTDSVDAGWRLSLLGEAGQALVGWDGRGTERQSEYDELLRPVAIIERDQVVERFTYGGPQTADDNQCNQLTRLDDTAGTLYRPDYGLLGSPLTEVRHFLRELDMPDWPLAVAERAALLEANGLESGWGFNALNEVIEQTDAMGNTRQFKHTVAGQLKSVVLGEQVLVSEIHYNAFDQVEQETAGNGVISRSTYDPQSGRLIELRASLADAPPLQLLKYDYDPVGNILQIEDAAQPVRFFANQRIEPVSHYRYDTLYQLIEASGREVKTAASHGPALPELQNLPIDPNQIANYTQSYQYDAGGNLLEMKHVGAQSFTRIMQVAANSNRSLSEEVDVDFANGFDANGNLQQLVRGQDLSWNVRNQLRHITSVQRDNGPSDDEIYIYDGSGQRCRKVSSAQAQNRTLINEVRYLPGLEIRTSADGEILHVISADAGRNSVRLLHWQARKPDDIDNNQLRYSLSDHLGSSTMELDQRGSLISQESYYPFGGTAWWAARGVVEAKYKTVRYSGKERDASGLYYYGFRYYAPWLQRWINPDPAGDVDGLNRFRFVKNRPVALSDNVGLSPQVTLLYGFDSVREQVFQKLSQLSDRTFVTMDKINAGLGITPESLEGDYEVIIGDLKGGYEVDPEGVDAFMAISPSYQGSANEASIFLQSWSDYLTAHQESFDIQRKMLKYQGAQGATKAAEFWRKNLDKPIPLEQLEQFTAVLQQEPEALYSNASGYAKEARTGVTNWLFRRLSKMGLDWMIKTQSAQSDTTNVWFLDAALTNPGSSSSDLQALTPDMFESHPYKANSSAKNTYGPITYSERRHLERNIASNDLYLRRTKLLSLKEVKSYRG